MSAVENVQTGKPKAVDIEQLVGRLSPADQAELRQRLDYALDATYEIDQLARLMPGLVPLDDGQRHYAIRGISARMLRLTSLLMDCVAVQPASDYNESNARSLLMLTDIAQG
jgi:hypothetical protein